MIDKIVVSYDYRDRAYNRFAKKYNPFFAFIDLPAHYFNKRLFENLKKLDIEIKIVTHDENSNIKRKLDYMEKSIEKSDLVFYDTFRLAMDLDESEWKIEYRKAIRDMIYSKFLKKSHFLDKELNYASKQNARKIAEKHKIPTPTSCTIDEYLDSDMKLPVVLKENESTGGSGIYFIEKKKQIRKFFNEKLYDGKIIECLSCPKRGDYEVQEFIECPSNHFTQYRVFALGDGTILGSVLNVSRNTKDENEIKSEKGPFGPGKSYFNCIDSPLYLGLRSIISNHANGAFQIPFDRNEKTKHVPMYFMNVIADHGYKNPKNPKLNIKLKSLVKKTAKVFSKYGVLFSGQDWIQDTKGKFYFLEINPSPAMNMFNILYNLDNGNSYTAREIATKILANAIRNYKT